MSDAWKAESALARSLARRWTAVPDPHRAIRHLKRAFDERIVAAARVALVGGAGHFLPTPARTVWR